MSTLTAFPFIAEGSEATPGLWNRMFSQLSDNLQSVNLGHFQELSIGSTPPSYVTTAAITVAVNSAFSDYLYLTDSSGARSNYVIGSRAGGTADGLNIWDASGATMIASFSKQSIRFYQNVVGPVFDVGGALADTLNAATFGTGADSLETRIQAAINAASLQGLSRVYLPANMYPYSASSISFIAAVQMVREGGDWSVSDIQAYGASGDGSSTSSTHNRAAIQAALTMSAGMRPVMVSAGTYVLAQPTLLIPSNTELVGQGWQSTLFFSWSTSNTSDYIQNTGYATASRNTNIRLRLFQMMGGGTGIRDPNYVPTAPQGINLRSVSSFVIQDMKLTRCVGITLGYKSCVGGRILNNLVFETGIDGITGFYGNHDIIIANNTLIGLGDDGIAVVSDDGVTFGTPQNIAILGNTIFGQSLYTLGAQGRGIAVIGGQSVTIEGNIIESTFGRGILISPSENSAAIQPDRIQIIGNRIRSSGSAGNGTLSEGLSINTCHYAIVAGNEISNSSGKAVIINGCKFVVLNGNSIVSNGRRINNDSLAIDVSTSTSSFLAITNNIIQGNAAAGIAFRYSVNALVEGNLIVDNGRTGDGTNNLGSGIYMEGGTTSDQVFHISNNYITDTAAVGAKLQSYGIRSAGGASRATLHIVGNFLSGNSGSGVVITGSAPAGLFQYGNFGYESSNPNIVGWFSPSAVTAGSAILPGLSFASEVSLGWYRSAASEMALSYGTLVLTDVLLRARANSGTLPQYRFWAGSGQHMQFSLGRAANEMHLYVANSNNAFNNSTIAGDSIVQAASGATLHLASGNSWPQMSLFTRSGRNIVSFLQSGLISIRTLATSLDSTTMTKGEMAFTILASGATLAVQSGSTIFFFTSSASTLAP
jgi:hypothetical protein